jgi:hypothetical protein
MVVQSVSYIHTVLYSTVCPFDCSELALPAKNETPSRTIVLTIFDDMPRLDCFVFYKICAPFGEVGKQSGVHLHFDIFSPRTVQFCLMLLDLFCLFFATVFILLIIFYF